MDLKAQDNNKNYQIIQSYAEDTSSLGNSCAYAF